MVRSRRGIAWIVCVTAAGLCAAAYAQTKPTPTRKRAERLRQTTILVELLTGAEGVGLRAQEWHEVFEELGVELRVRRALLDEKAEVKERNFGATTREVYAIGTLEKDGSIAFPGRRFKQSDAAKLKEWLAELKVYGAQGSPEGQPLWGLSKQQFEPIYHVLSAKLEVEPQGMEFDKALATFDFPKTYPAKPSVRAQERLAQQPAGTVKPALKGFSKGTALAILLNQYSLGFRPRRTAEGTLEIAIVTLEEAKDVWPIGWPLKQEGYEAAPQLFKLINVGEFTDEPLVDILEALPDFIEIPVLIDYHGLAVHKIDLAAAKVTFPRKQTTWSSALRGLLFKAKLRREVWSDELGKPFVWVTPLAADRRPEE